MKHIFLFFVLILFCVLNRQVYGVSLHYNAHGAGMHLMNANMNLDVSKNDFRIKSTAKTNGLLKMILDARSNFYSSGKTLNNQFVINNSYIEALSKNKSKKRDVNLKDKPNFMDYQTALLHVMYFSEPQDKTFQVFDGKRELSLTFKYIGQEILLPIPEMMYSGISDYYTLTISITKGKKKGWFFNRMDDKDNPPLHLYFASIDGINHKVMVKGVFNTSLFGEINIYLNKISDLGEK
ncbi:MAG: DUF3108 domain-containing protein [Alphaproteobacteria bacterium]|nr:DUF3108 domain-containing protein [Alphaproteobacteria bacterium]